MSITAKMTRENQRKTLVRIASIAAVFTLLATAFLFYLGFTTLHWHFYVVALFLMVFFVISFVIISSRKNENPRIVAWHFFGTLLISVFLISTLQANIAAEIGAALLIISVVVAIQTLPREHVNRGIILGVIASMLTSLLIYYTPFPQFNNPNADEIGAWVARGVIAVVLAITMTRFQSYDIANKLLLAFFGTVVLIGLTVNIVVSATTSVIITEQVGKEIQLVAESRGALIGDYLREQIEVLRALSSEDQVIDAINAANARNLGQSEIMDLDARWQSAFERHMIEDPAFDLYMENELSHEFVHFQNLFNELEEILVTGNTGAIVATSQFGPNFYHGDQDWWRSGYYARRGNAFISQPGMVEISDSPVIFIALPINDPDGGQLIGAMRATLSLIDILDLLNVPIGETGQVDLIFSREPAMVVHQGSLRDLEPLVLTHIEQVDQSAVHVISTVYEGENSLFTAANVKAAVLTPEIDRLGWKIGIHQREAEALRPVREQVRLISFLVSILAGIAVLVSLLTARRMSGPIVSLTEIANEVSGGNLEARVSVETQDEIGQLASSFNTMTANLQETLRGLEERVAERTEELEESAKQIQRRADQFEAVAILARTIASDQDLKTLLPRITELVSQHFNFYHSGLFLLDESGHFAVLSAANSEGGKRMLARKHRLRVGQEGIVGFVTSMGKPRIALDTGADAVYFDNPDLPETRSEMALPLHVGDKIIGALDVQSTEPNAFSEDDVEVLTILSDEISIAIENARLSEETRRLLADAQSAVDDYTQDAWRKLSKKRKVVGYELSGATIRSLEEPVNDNQGAIEIPIKLRNQVIGMVNINPPENDPLDEEELDITRALAERVGAAVETATLLEDSRKRAQRERLVSEITTKIRSTNDPKVMIQTALEELKESLGATEVDLVPHEVKKVQTTKNPTPPSDTKSDRKPRKEGEKK